MVKHHHVVQGMRGKVRKTSLQRMFVSVAPCLWWFLLRRSRKLSSRVPSLPLAGLFCLGVQKPTEKETNRTRDRKMLSCHAYREGGMESMSTSQTLELEVHSLTMGPAHWKQGGMVGV